MKKIAIGIASVGILCGCQFADARMPEPDFMPQDLKGGEPHAPEVAHYYLEELVKEGKMTQQEADRTEVYMISVMPVAPRILRMWKDYPKKKDAK